MSPLWLSPRQGRSPATAGGHLLRGGNLGGLAVSMSGSHSGNKLNLQVYASGYAPAAYAATVEDATHINGTLSG